MKAVLIFAAFSICLLAGCASHKHSGARRGAPPQKLRDTDEFKIDEAVYGYLLQRHFWDGGEYTAIFLQGEDAEVDAIRRDYPNHVPPIKPGKRAKLHPNRTPIDRDTDKPAMILGVEASEPVNDTVEAIGTWYAGGAMSGHYTFSLKKVNGEWTIESVQ
ncbi:MAG: hypothetical protein ABSC01_10655 [Verrucomicrobiota bacterium]